MTDVSRVAWALFSAIRPKHWLKNLLVLVAPLGAAALTLENIGAVLGAFLGLSLTASATYLVNDVVDRDKDRAHSHKRHRAIAAGRVSPAAALAIAAVLLVVAGTLSWFVSPAFLAVVASYLVATLFYSFWLKTAPAIDIVMLALFSSFGLLPVELPLRLLCRVGYWRQVFLFF